MPALHNVATHALIRPVLDVLNPQELSAHTFLAEFLLGVNRLYTGSDAETVELAIVLQIKRQVNMGIDVDVSLVQSWADGDTSTTYRDALGWRDSVAQMLMNEVAGTKDFADRMGYSGIVRSVRNNGAA